MRRREKNFSGTARLFMLALVLALVLWWAVSINAGSRRPAPKPLPRPPERKPTPAKFRHDRSAEFASVGEVVVIDDEEPKPLVNDDPDDYWPDIIDA
jgi:hypothetical protein